MDGYDYINSTTLVVAFTNPYTLNHTMSNNSDEARRWETIQNIVKVMEKMANGIARCSDSNAVINQRIQLLQCQQRQILEEVNKATEVGPQDDTKKAMDEDVTLVFICDEEFKGVRAKVTQYDDEEGYVQNLHIIVPVEPHEFELDTLARIMHWRNATSGHIDVFAVTIRSLEALKQQILKIPDTKLYRVANKDKAIDAIFDKVDYDWCT